MAFFMSTNLLLAFGFELQGEKSTSTQSDTLHWNIPLSFSSTGSTSGYFVDLNECNANKILFLSFSDSMVRLSEYSSIIEIPPFTPCVVYIGIPAEDKTSISR